MTICRSSDGEECTGEWQDDSIVFTDRNGDHQINQDDEILLLIEHGELFSSIKWRAFQNRQYLQITSQGFTRYQNGNFTYCTLDKDPSKALQLVINRTSRMRFAMDTDGDGFREVIRGRPIDSSNWLLCPPWHLWLRYWSR